MPRDLVAGPGRPVRLNGRFCLEDKHTAIIEPDDRINICRAVWVCPAGKHASLRDHLRPCKVAESVDDVGFHDMAPIKDPLVIVGLFNFRRPHLCMVEARCCLIGANTKNNGCLRASDAYMPHRLPLFRGEEGRVHDGDRIGPFHSWFGLFTIVHHKDETGNVFRRKGVKALRVHVEELFRILGKSLPSHACNLQGCLQKLHSPPNLCHCVVEFHHDTGIQPDRCILRQVVFKEHTDFSFLLQIGFLSPQATRPPTSNCAQSRVRILAIPSSILSRVFNEAPDCLAMPMHSAM